MDGSFGPWRRCSLLALLAVALHLSGCGSSSANVTGKVYYNDNLVKGGKIIFVCADGRSVPTDVREDGSYSLDKLPVGTAKICVDTSSLDPKRRKSYNYSAPAGMKKDLPEAGSEGADKQAGEYVAIPAKYADPVTTDLTCELKGGSQTFDVRIK